MFIDASAVVAIIANEPAANDLTAKIEAATSSFYTSPLAVWESVAALARIMKVDVKRVQPIVDAFHEALGATSVDITHQIALVALEAFSRYGKGSGHAAGLNMGDCFSYAAAKACKVPLLYIGNDFGQTDMALLGRA
jgi:ribonuclease VapC